MKNSIVVSVSSGGSSHNVYISPVHGVATRAFYTCVLAAVMSSCIVTGLLSLVLNANYAGFHQGIRADAVWDVRESNSTRAGFVKARALMGAGLYGQPNDAEVAGVLDFIDFEQRILFNLVPNGLPLNEYRRVSSKYGMRDHPILRKLRLHKGLDFSVAPGTPIYSTADGVVEVADAWDDSSYGKYVVVRHGLGFTSLYAHMRDVEVKVGDYIDKGTLLGFSGNSGRSSSPHLHYEVKYLGRALDPESFTEWSGDNYEVIFSKEKTVPWASLMEKIAQWRSVASAGGGQKTAL